MSIVHKRYLEASSNLHRSGKSYRGVASSPHQPHPTWCLLHSIALFMTESRQLQLNTSCSDDPIFISPFPGMLCRRAQSYIPSPFYSPLALGMNGSD